MNRIAVSVAEPKRTVVQERVRHETITLPTPKLLSRTYTRAQRGRVVIGDVLYEPGGSFGPRRQQDYQLVIIHSGSLTLVLDSDVLEIPEGYGILLSPGHLEQFSFSCDRETRHSWIALDAGLLAPELCAEVDRYRGPFPFLGRPANLLDLARQGLDPSDEGDPQRNRMYEALGTAILWAFVSAVSAGIRSVSSGTSVLWRMDRFIAESYAQSITLNEIARAAGASRQHLLKLCRMCGKPTPTVQLYARRLEAAADLLANTGFSVAQIAEQCGFPNQFHFSRKFKQAFGHSPSKWRDQVWTHPTKQISCV